MANENKHSPIMNKNFYRFIETGCVRLGFPNFGLIEALMWMCVGRSMITAPSSETTCYFGFILSQIYLISTKFVEISINIYNIKKLLLDPQ